MVEPAMSTTKSLFGLKNLKFKSRLDLATPESEAAFQRLSVTTIPHHYTLCIKPNLATLSFEGCVAIKVMIRKECKTITLNAADLNISKIMWEEDVTENRQEPIEYILDNNKQQLKVQFEPALLPNRGILRINFNGDIGDKHAGFYRSRYISSDGEEKFNAVTRFQPSEARSCFPCWDEPALKATFDISLILPRNLTALSNMPIKVTYPHRTKLELHVVEFVTTPAMSTYSIGFAIGAFDYVEAKTPNGTKCRIFTSPGKSSLAEAALVFCTSLIPVYEKFFGFPYPLPKLDIVAVDDLSHVSVSTSGWGLMFFRESRLLLDIDEVSAIPVRIALSMAVSHELCLQWVGNLVSTEWWSSFWLYEAFAMYMSYQTINELESEYDLWVDFVSEKYAEALIMDSLKSSHPVEVSIGQPAELKETMDKLCCFKSASLLRMLQNYLGEDIFRKGVNLFLTQRQFKGGRSEELWIALESVSAKPVVGIMSSWTRQMGFPLVKIVSTRYELNQRTVVLSQEKFWADPLGRENKQINKDYIWQFPISVAISSHPTRVVKEVIMDKRNFHFTIPNISRTQLFKLNPGTIGFFRVKYPPEMLGQFLQAIRVKSIPPSDRLGVVSDLFAMCMTGLNSAVELFSLLEAFSDEDSYLVWTRLDYIFSTLEGLMQSAEAFPKLKYFGIAIYNNVYERVGWNIDPGEKYEHTKLRILVINRMFMFDHEKCKEEAVLRFDKLNEEIPPVGLRHIIYKAGMDVGNSDTYRALLRLYREAEAQDERERIMSAFGYIKDDEILHDALDFAISEVRHQDAVIIFKSVCSTPKGRVIAWDFFKEHWTLFRSRYPAGPLLVELIEAITFGFTTEEKSTEISEFFRDHVFPGADRTIHQAMERIHIATTFMKHESALIQDYLTTYE